ncbi:hypothetical protein AgCh_014686 [Apium graveolens]
MCDSAMLSFMQSMFLFLGICMLASNISGAQSVGVCYGRNGDNLPNEQETIDLFKANGIKKMRLYDPVQEAYQALRGSNIEVILDVPNRQLQSLQDPASARTWVQDNIQNNIPGVNFRYIAVGNEVDPDPNSGTSQYVDYVLPVMKNVHDAIVAAGLQDQIKVSTATYSGVTSGFPPSQGLFDENAKGFMDPIIKFLAQNNLPLLANIYPYFSHVGTNPPGDLQYALFTAPNVVVTDPVGNREYRNLFDALLDTMYSAVENSTGQNIEIIVSESGWPSSGHKEASVENAGTYNRNLINHVKNGTPKRPGKLVEAYIFAMYDENRKGGLDTERNFGLFNPTDRKLKYQLSF